MKVLFIGGSGNISSAASRLALSKGIDLYLLNRGNRSIGSKCAKSIVADIGNEKEVATAIQSHRWDVVVNWIAFGEQDVERDIRLFAGKTAQYIFISSASAYHVNRPYSKLAQVALARDAVGGLLRTLEGGQ